MKEKIRSINYCTHSNLNDLSFGDSNNDNKFINSIPSKFYVNKVFPKRNKDNSIKFLNLLKIVLKLLFLSVKYKQIFLIRGTRPGFLPVFFKKMMKHIIILNMGCTPFSTIERTAFMSNPSYKPKFNIISKLLIKIEFQFEKLLIRKADFIFVENLTAKRLVTKFCSNAAKITILPYYVQDYFLINKDLTYNPNDLKQLVIGYTGRFHKYDKLDPLIDAIKILKSENFPIKMKLVGDGPIKAEIQKKVKNLKLEENFEFLGPQPHEKVSEIIDTEHILILPMINNICPTTIPIKILEGIIKGKIILTNNSGNIRSLFRPYNELVLQDFSNPKKIAKKIIEIAQNYQKYYHIAQIIRKRHLESRNIQYFKNQIERTLNLIN
ncbi:MAG: glycosyltransferase [Candidatus Thorarchaeota archaeon]